MFLLFQFQAVGGFFLFQFRINYFRGECSLHAHTNGLSFLSCIPLQQVFVECLPHARHCFSVPVTASVFQKRFHVSHHWGIKIIPGV